MKRSTASKYSEIIADNLAGSMEREASYSTTREAIHNGVFEQLFEFLPEESKSLALGEREGELPMVLALHENTLFICRYEADQLKEDRFRPALTSRWIAPSKGTVHISTWHWKRSGKGLVPREVNWCFSLSDPSDEISFTTVREPYEENDTGLREPFAFALSAALGCDLGPPSTSS